MKRRWYAQLGSKRIQVIECLDSGNRRVWIKFEPVDKSSPMEVCNIVDQPDRVSWTYTDSHFETIDNTGKTNYYPASTAGSMRLDAGTTDVLKDPESKVILFPLDMSGSIDVYNYTQAGSQFQIYVDKPTWVAFAVSGSGSINPK